MAEALKAKGIPRDCLAEADGSGNGHEFENISRLGHSAQMTIAACLTAPPMGRRHG